MTLKRPLMALAPLILCATTALSAPLEGFDPLGRGVGYPDAASGRGEGKPSLATHRIETGAIEIDGRLDEADWVAAPAATGFTQFNPDRGGEPCEQTVFKVMYDEDALYVGVACYRENGTPITSCLSRRDNITSSDRIRVYIDPFHDLNTGYHFRLNPDGVKEDYYNYDDLYHDVSWDAVWEAETYVDESGWYAEIRLPFSSVRYRASESMTWGFNVFQYVHNRGERSAWSNWDRDQSGFMSRSGTITGIRDVRPPRQLEITPYLLAGTTDPADPAGKGFYGEEWDHLGNFGADLKYGVTADLTLNATFQPDFGQVEADPSQLNLSPFETYYEEKRPFFVEGAQFFYHPNFPVFYSRRIGTGSENSRIRFAGKLTGKMAGNVSTAVMVAATDETGAGQSHNPFADGHDQTWYAIGRFGRQFGGGAHQVGLMQTAVIRDTDSYSGPTRDGYVTGGDFKLRFRDRMYEFTGSFVASVVDEAEWNGHDPDPSHGLGWRAEVKKAAGDWTGALTARLQSDKLDLNDMGYLNDPNHYAVQAWIDHAFNDDSGERLFNEMNVNLRWYRSWIYAGRDFADPDAAGETLWSYERGHDLLHNLTFEAYTGLRNHWGFWAGGEFKPDNIDLFGTRWLPDWSGRGPLLVNPRTIMGWVGFHSDGTKKLSMDMNLAASGDRVGARGRSANMSLSWVQSSRLGHQLSLSYSWHKDDAQWLMNETSETGIGGVSYVFAELDRRVWDATLRSRLLFNRDQSLELYVQPFLAVGDYSAAKELVQADSYEFTPYTAGGFEVTDRNFNMGAVDLNMVYRWEYRPGSTLFLVWSHSRFSSERLGDFDGDRDRFRNDFHTAPIFDMEPENRFMAKLSYWFAV